MSNTPPTGLSQTTKTELPFGQHVTGSTASTTSRSRSKALLAPGWGDGGRTSPRAAGGRDACRPSVLPRQPEDERGAEAGRQRKENNLCRSPPGLGVLHHLVAGRTQAQPRAPGPGSCSRPAGVGALQGRTPGRRQPPPELPKPSARPVGRGARAHWEQCLPGPRAPGCTAAGPGNVPKCVTSSGCVSCAMVEGFPCGPKPPDGL